MVKIDEKDLLAAWTKEIADEKWDIDVYETRGSDASVSEFMKALKDPGSYGMDMSCQSIDRVWDIFEANFKDFLKRGYVDVDDWDRRDADTIYDGLLDKDEFRIPFEEASINQNWVDFFNFDVLLVKPIGVDRLEEGGEKEAWKILKKHATESEFDNVKRNTAYTNGYWFIGAIVNAKWLLEQVAGGKKIVGVKSSIFGVHDGFEGDAFFGRAMDVPMLMKIKATSCDENGVAHVDSGNYGIGGIFGTNDWKWK